MEFRGGVKGNVFSGSITYTETNSEPKGGIQKSEEYVIHGVAKIQFKTILFKNINQICDNYDEVIAVETIYNGTVFVKFEKIDKGDDLMLTIQCNDHQHYHFKNNTSWMEIHSYEYIKDDDVPDYDDFPVSNYFPVKITLDLLEVPKFVGLYKDDDLTDFKLTDGVNEAEVNIHKSVLSNYTEVMKPVIQGDWKEGKEGRLRLNTTADVLCAFKDYLYLDKLPNDLRILEDLLELACCYMIKDLMQKCTVKILFNLTGDQAMHFLRLAHKLKIKTLFNGIGESSRAGCLGQKRDILMEFIMEKDFGVEMD